MKKNLAATATLLILAACLGNWLSPHPTRATLTEKRIVVRGQTLELWKTTDEQDRKHDEVTLPLDRSELWTIKGWFDGTPPQRIEFAPSPKKEVAVNESRHHSQFVNPVPGTTRNTHGGASYDWDSGADIHTPVGTDVVVVANGRIVYAEHGHTPWEEDQLPDVPGLQRPWSVLVKLDVPYVYRDGDYSFTVNDVWYTHLATVENALHWPDNGVLGPQVKAGQALGTTGIGNKAPHLHIGYLYNRAQRNENDWLPPRRALELVFPRD